MVGEEQFVNHLTITGDSIETSGFFHEHSLKLIPGFGEQLWRSIQREDHQEQFRRF